MDVAWGDHWLRMERYFGRIHKARFGLGAPEDTWTPDSRALIHDDFLTYLVHAHHLKDWLRAAQIDVAREVGANRMLRLCADVANATKHVKLTSPRIGQPQRGSNSVTLIMGKDGMKVGTDVAIEINGKRISAYDLAWAVRQAWIALLTAKGLEPDIQEFSRPDLRRLTPIPDGVLETVPGDDPLDAVFEKSGGGNEMNDESR